MFFRKLSAHSSRRSLENRRQLRRPIDQTSTRQVFFSYHGKQGVDVTGRQSANQPRREPPVARSGPNGGQSFTSRITHERIPIILTALVLAVSLLYMTTLNTTPRIIVRGDSRDFKSLRSVGVYQDAAQSFLQGSILNRSKLTINRTGLEKDMQNEFPELQNVSIELPLVGHRPVIQASSDKPALLIAGGSGLYVVGATGRVLMKSSEASALPDLPTVQDETELDIRPGRAALSVQDVAYITTIAKQFSRKGVDVTSMTLPALASELHVRISDKPYYIKFSLLGDARTAAGQYFALMKKLDADGVVPGEYVDSRVEERIFYK